MSRSPDSLNGTSAQALLSEEDRTGTTSADHDGSNDRNSSADRPSIPLSPGHRKTQSLLSAMPSTALSGEPRRHRGRHHRHRSSIGQILETIGEGIQLEATVVQDVWKTELEEGDEGRRFFLDMNLTRSLSLLPEDISEFAHEAISLSERTAGSFLLPQEPEEPIPHTPSASLGSCLALLSAVLAVSSNGTALAMLHDVHPALKLFWRMSAVATVLGFFALKTMVLHYREEGQFLPRLSTSQWMTFGLAALCFFLHTLLLFTALNLTSIGNAVIGANSQALLLVLGKLLTGQTVVWMEGLGVLVAFGGCILCVGDEAHDDEPKDTDLNGTDYSNHGGVDLSSIVGDLMALGSAAFGVCYLTFAKAVRSHLSVTVFMFLVMLAGCILDMIYLCFLGTNFTFDTDPHFGLFGWMTLHDNHVWILLYIAVVCNVVGTMGFVRAMEYFENIVIAVATLLEPMIATLIAFALGVGELPGLLGWIGNLFVAIGTLGVVFPSMNKPGAGGH